MSCITEPSKKTIVNLNMTDPVAPNHMDAFESEEYEEVDLVLAYLPQHWEWVPILTGFNELIPEVLMVTGESRTMAAENGTEQRCP
ncbi:unnamed protein product [Caretta caretta]